MRHLLVTRENQKCVVISGGFCNLCFKHTRGNRGRNVYCTGLEKFIVRRKSWELLPTRSIK
jgi:hypothetical protein